MRHVYSIARDNQEGLTELAEVCDANLMVKPDDVVEINSTLYVITERRLGIARLPDSMKCEYVISYTVVESRPFQY